MVSMEKAKRNISVEFISSLYSNKIFINLIKITNNLVVHGGTNFRFVKSLFSKSLVRITTLSFWIFSAPPYVSRHSDSGLKIHGFKSRHLLKTCLRFGEIFL